MTDGMTSVTSTGGFQNPKIGPYEVERKLGAGGMGTVYLGTHEETQQQAAVKVLSASLAQDDGIVERFMREIDAMKQLNAPNIVSLLESGTDEDTGQLYFAMEYVEGETLGDRLKRVRRLPWDQAVDIGLQICAALKAAHNAGIIHRDLKPSNLLLSVNGLVKLTDFGVAQVFAAQRLTITGGVIGTAEYMSPEQTEGKRATKTSDLYSLGAVLYVMLTGRPPFTGKTALDILRQHQMARFDRPSLYVPDLPRVFEELVCKLLEKKPEDRYADAHIVSLRLKEVVKRVELAHRESEQDVGTYGLTAPTAVAHSPRETAETRPAIKEGEGVASGPSPATIMRDMFKAEAAREQAQSPLAAFFDQTWVLIVCFALLIGGGIWWFNNPRQLISEATDSTNANTEVDRILKRAEGLKNAGLDVEEEKTLVALLTLMELDQEQHEKTISRVKLRLKFLRKARDKQHKEFALAREALDQARAAFTQSRLQKAKAIALSVIHLYQDESAARTIVGEANQLLQKIADKLEVPTQKR